MSFFKKKPLSPAMQNAYRKAYNQELASIKSKANQAAIAKVQARAKADAARASQSTGSRVLDGLVSAGRDMNKALKKMDTEKFERYITGVETEKKRR